MRERFNLCITHQEFPTPASTTQQCRAGTVYSKPVSRASALIYSVCWFIGRFIYVCTMNLYIVGRKVTQRRGPYILAVSHLSHLEPAVVALMIHRRIDWVARIEFYRNA